MQAKKKLIYWKKRILVSLWIAYAAFYLCRVNMSVALPGIMEEFGLSKTSMGIVLTALFFAYAIGQFVNGQLGDKFGARHLITCGALVSAALNAIFAFLPGVVTLMMLVWGLNGYFQSMGWGPSVKTIANWFPLRERGKTTALFGSSYQFGNAASWGLAGFVVGAFGWRWAFWAPAIIFSAIGIFWFIRGRNAPEEVGLPTVEEVHEEKYEFRQPQPDYHLGFIYTIKTVLNDKKVWLVGLALFGLNIISYGLMGWVPTYMFEVEKVTISMAAYKAILIPIAGSLGAFFAGWSSDKFFHSRRAPIIVIMLIWLAIFTFIFPKLSSYHWLWSFVCLIGIGFNLHGPHVMICITLPMDYASRKAAASYAGFIDGLGCLGASVTGFITGYLVEHYGWKSGFYFWISGVVMAIVLMSFLWNYKPTKGKYH